MNTGVMNTGVMNTGLMRPLEDHDSVCCAQCGMTAEALPLTWSTQSSARGVTFLGDRCTRDKLRAIEGKLDEAWW